MVRDVMISLRHSIACYAKPNYISSRKLHCTSAVFDESRVFFTLQRRSPLVPWLLRLVLDPFVVFRRSIKFCRPVLFGGGRHHLSVHVCEGLRLHWSA
ncbi:hypothetical protein SUGI_0017370 [Cryptomeria japonica]|nr:hypothetical protein SUGI_0017370 [Cryptomeria japonica]